MARTAAVGLDNFEKIIEGNYFYVDKTDFIREWWENGDKVTLITRPRRFGKTLTLSMTEQFFSVNYAGRGELFRGLSIWKEEKLRGLQGSYPVLNLSFAGIKSSCFATAREMICQEIVRVYMQNRFLLDHDTLALQEKEYFNSISDTMSDAAASAALNRMSGYLTRYYGKNVIILLDEYDTPMQEAYLAGYWEEMLLFTRSLFHSSFKTNPYLERAILTGITRVSKESIFSDLNNLKVITVTSPKYAFAFGFTEEEVFLALEEYGLSHKKAEVQQWYDGFQFGSCGHIYNPWSVLNLLAEKKIAPYWAHTSSNRLIEKLIRENGAEIKIMMEDLLNGGTRNVTIEEEVAYSQLDHDADAVWSLFLAGGYLKIDRIQINRRGKEEYTLSLTNRESRAAFDEIVTGWFSNGELKYDTFTDALLSDNKKYMNEYLNVIAQETFSSFDTGRKVSRFKQPENFYHGFVLGLIADLREIYTITSNRESGDGRYDVLMEPKNAVLDDGIILEFKVQEAPEASLQDTVRAAWKQILVKKYSAVLEAKGISKERIRIYGFAFRGKEVLIDGGRYDMLQQKEAAGNE